MSGKICIVPIARVTTKQFGFCHSRLVRCKKRSALNRSKLLFFRINLRWNKWFNSSALTIHWWAGIQPSPAKKTDVSHHSSSNARKSVTPYRNVTLLNQLPLSKITKYDNLTEKKLRNEFPTGTMITYKCWNPLARPAGDPTITCDENGNWSEISFTCDSVCKPPMSISNSEQLIRNESDDFVPISGKLFGVGVTVHYKCKPGYYTRRNKKTQGKVKFQLLILKSL